MSACGAVYRTFRFVKLLLAINKKETNTIASHAKKGYMLPCFLARMANAISTVPLRRLVCLGSLIYSLIHHAGVNRTRTKKLVQRNE